MVRPPDRLTALLLPQKLVKSDTDRTSEAIEEDGGKRSDSRSNERHGITND